MSLSLSPLSELAAEDVFKLWSDRDAVKMTNWPYLTALTDVRERLAKVCAYYGAEPRHFGPFVVRESDGRFVGLVGADLRDEATQQYEVWYFLEHSQRGRGLGKQSLQTLLAEMKHSRRVQVAKATAVVDNPASWRLLEKCGFRRLALIPEGHTKHDQKLDLFEYELEIVRS